MAYNIAVFKIQSILDTNKILRDKWNQEKKEYRFIPHLVEYVHTYLNLTGTKGIEGHTNCQEKLISGGGLVVSYIFYQSIRCPEFFPFCCPIFPRFPHATSHVLHAAAVAFLQPQTWPLLQRAHVLPCSRPSSSPLGWIALAARGQLLLLLGMLLAHLTWLISGFWLKCLFLGKTFLTPDSFYYPQPFLYDP